MLTHRVVYSDNSVLTDRSLESKKGGFTQTIVSDEDYIYIGQQFPFNSLFLEITTANTNAGIMSIDYWNNKTWISAVDVLDATSVSGVTLAQDGVIRFTVNRKEGWNKIDDTSDTTGIGDLDTIAIYQLYWIRIKVSADTSATSFGEIAYLFTDNDLVESLDPDINQYLSNWEAGKTDWQEQLLVASRQVVLSLKQNGIIRDVAQILLIDRDLELLTAYKALSIIYSGLGGDKFNTKKKDVDLTYDKLLSGINVVVDENGDGLLNQNEIKVRQGSPIR